MGYIVNLEEIMEEHKDLPVYSCGSINLYKFLLINEMMFIQKYKSKKTKKNIWVFVKTKKLQELLKYWTENNPNGKLKGEVPKNE